MQGVRIARDVVNQAAFDGIRGEELQPGPSVATQAELEEWVLVSQGITSWAQLGRLSARRWMATSAAVPQKRLSDIHIDMKDPKRLGPGHMHNLDKFWSQAFKDL